MAADNVYRNSADRCLNTPPVRFVVTRDSLVTWLHQMRRCTNAYVIGYLLKFARIMLVASWHTNCCYKYLSRL